MLNPALLLRRPPERGENFPKPIVRIEALNPAKSATSSPSPPRSGGEGWGEVVRLIFKGVPISKQYLENLPIT
jgi:hypothetical protein